MKRLTTLTLLAASTLAAGGITASAVGAPGGSGGAVTVGAPCEGPASIALRLAHNDEPHQGPKLAVTVSDAGPRSLWTLQLEQYQGDSGSVLQGDFRADEKGVWRYRSWTSGGFVEIIAAATSRSGNECEVSWKGRFEPL